MQMLMQFRDDNSRNSEPGQAYDYPAKKRFAKCGTKIVRVKSGPVVVQLFKTRFKCYRHCFHEEVAYHKFSLTRRHGK